MNEGSSIFFNDTATTEIYTLSLHAALPISRRRSRSYVDVRCADGVEHGARRRAGLGGRHPGARSEEHTSELQSRRNLVCRLLLEKKKLTFIFSYEYITGLPRFYVQILFLV